MLTIARAEPLAGHLDHSCTRGDLDHQLHLRSDDEIAEVVKDRVAMDRADERVLVRTGARQIRFVIAVSIFVSYHTFREAYS